MFQFGMCGKPLQAFLLRSVIGCPIKIVAYLGRILPFTSCIFLSHFARITGTLEQINHCVTEPTWPHLCDTLCAQTQWTPYTAYAIIYWSLRIWEWLVKVFHMHRVCLLSQLAPKMQSNNNNNNNKKPTNIGAPREFLKKMCLPCLIILIRSCYFDCRINNPLAYSRRVITCVSFSVHVISTY